MVKRKIIQLKCCPLVFVDGALLLTNSCACVSFLSEGAAGACSGGNPGDEGGENPDDL